MIIGLILVAVGAIALAQQMGIISGSIWSYTWPLILIILGLSMLRGRRFGRRWHGVWGWGPCFPYEEGKKEW